MLETMSSFHRTLIKDLTLYIVIGNNLMYPKIVLLKNQHTHTHPCKYTQYSKLYTF